MFVELLRSPGINSQPGRYDNPMSLYLPAKIYRLAESIPLNRFLVLNKRLQIRAQYNILSTSCLTLITSKGVPPCTSVPPFSLQYSKYVFLGMGANSWHLFTEIRRKWASHFYYRGPSKHVYLITQNGEQKKESYNDDILMLLFNLGSLLRMSNYGDVQYNA